MASRLQRPFSDQRTKLIAAGALLVWLTVYLATFQVAYSYDLYWLLTRD